MECIARVREVAGADLAEALEGRAAISDFDRLVRNGAASPLQEASNIPLVQLHLWEACCLRPAGLRIGLHRRHYLPAGQPRALAKSAGAAEERNLPYRHEAEHQALRAGLCAAISAQAHILAYSFPIRALIAL